jgi:hypothetical protein
MRKGFIHTLEAVIAATILIGTVTVVVPQVRPDPQPEDNTQQRIYQGLQTLDKTGDLRDNLSVEGIEKDVGTVVPDAFNYSVILKDVDTTTYDLIVDGGSYSPVRSLSVNSSSEWSGKYRQTFLRKPEDFVGLGYDRETLRDNLITYYRFDGSYGVVDGFEDGDISEYTIDTGQFQATQKKSYTGNRSLYTQNDFVSIQSTSGLNAYPEAGSNIAVRTLLNESGVSDFRIGVQDSENFYRIMVQENSLALKITQSNSDTSLATDTSFSQETSEWYKLDIQWKENGNITAELYGEQDNLQASVSAVNSTYTSGGVGFANTDGPVFWDDYGLKQYYRDYSDYRNYGSGIEVIRKSEGVFGTSSTDYSNEGNITASDDSLVQNLPNSSGITVSTWFYPEGYSNSMAYIWNKTGVSIYTYYDSFSNEAKLKLRAKFSNQDGIWSAGVPTIDSVWNHVTVSYNASSDTNDPQIYFNGTPATVTEESSPDGTYAGDASFRGYIGNVNQEWSGKLEEFRIYNTTTSASKAEKLYLEGDDGFFNGNFTSDQYTAADENNWSILTADTDLPSGSAVSAEIRSIDSGGTIVDTETINLNSGRQNYSISTADSKKLEIVFEGSTSDPTNTWKLRSYQVWKSLNGEKISYNVKGDTVNAQFYMEDTEKLNVSYNDDKIIDKRTENGYELFQLPSNTGEFSLTGDANLTVEIDNKSIYGESVQKDEVTNINYPLYTNNSKEVTVSVWQ